MAVKPTSILLVVIQLASFIAIILTGQIIPGHPIALLLSLSGVILGLWALWEMRKSKFRPTPEVAPETKLITTGPYRFIRHPMYLSMLIVGTALIINSFSFFRLFVLIILLVDLLIKLNYEEKLLGKHFKDYPDYQKKTSRLIPFIY